MPLGRIPMRSALIVLAFVAPCAALGAQSSGQSIHASLFADVNYMNSQRPVSQGFRLGQVAGHLRAAISDHIALFSEVSGTAQAGAFAIDAERFFVRYEANDFFKLSAGRQHTPVSYWNTTFHHGSWFQTTAGRPDLVRGSGLLPLHFVGLQLEGAVPLGPMSLGYLTGVGNGRNSSITRAGDAGDANLSRALVTNAFLKLPQSTGLKIGGAYYSDRVTPSAPIDVKEKIVSGFVVRERENPELLAEYAQITHQALTPVRPTVKSSSGYAQVGYRLPGRASQLKPYLRVERSHVPAGDTILTPLKLDYRGGTAGLRIDVDPVASIKLEFRRERYQAPRWFSAVTAQFSFTFPACPTRRHLK
jgi:hypothetical protein